VKEASIYGNGNQLSYVNELNQHPVAVIINFQRSLEVMMDQQSEKGELQTGIRGQVDRPVVLPDCYDGNNNFNTLVSHFEYVSEINGWTAEEKLLWVHVSLKGREELTWHIIVFLTRSVHLTSPLTLQKSKANLSILLS